VIPPQHLIVTCSPPADVADFWEQMTAAEPDLFNAWFVMAAGNGQDD
jgi:hypothetical protein